MPPRKRTSPRKAPSPKAKSSVAASVDRPRAKKPRTAPGNGKKRAGPYKMPPPIPKGEVLTDLRKNKWNLGTSVGKGGFGEIYTACPSGKSIDRAQHVIKIEPHENGPLFTELSFYTRIAKPERIDRWVNGHDLTYLPVPKFIASGSHDRQGTKYRFMVMDRFGEDVEKKFTSAGRKFSLGTVCYLAVQLIEALEFLHESEYVHADVKGSNLLTGFGAAHLHEVYLVDYGLAYRYCPDGEHKPYKEDPRRAHDGTIEFTSIDAHKGVNPSRRADMEILGYCLLQWASGRLPWEGNLENKEKVAKMKIDFHGDSEGLLKACFGGRYPPCLRQYMHEVYQLGYQDKPNYTKLKELFTKQLRDLGCHGDGKDMLDWISSRKAGQKRKAHDDVALEESSESEESPPPPKKKRVAKKSAVTDEGEVESTAASRRQAGKKTHEDQKRPASSKGQKRPASSKGQQEETSVDVQAQVYYPKALGYVNGDGSSEEEQAPREKKKRYKRKKSESLCEEESESETLPPKKRSTSKRTTRTKKTAVDKK